jgi:hypothetical protein
MAMQRCRTCGKPIAWYEHHRSGTAMPLDVTPSPAGNIIIVNEKAVVLTKGDPRWHTYPSSDRRTSHFATCSSAAQWRRKRTSAPS